MPWLAQRLWRNGVMGLNKRNATYLLPYNQRQYYPMADDKLLAKELAQQVGINVPTLYGIIEYPHEVRNYYKITDNYREFVVKPARGAGGDASLESEYGRTAGPALKELIEAGVTWRMGANSEREVRALLEVFGETGLPLVIDGAANAAGLADEIAKAGVSVVFAPRAGGTIDFGKGPDGNWPVYDVASKLAAAGVNVVVKPIGNTAIRDLRLSAALAMRGGMSAETALHAITLGPATLFGVADRVGSLELACR